MMSDKTQMVAFPRELGDELAELIAEKARVCGGGAFEIWEAICDQFGQPAPAAVTDEEASFKAWDRSGNPVSGINGHLAAKAAWQARAALGRSVVMPERRVQSDSHPYLEDDDLVWNSCLDDVAKLNGVSP